MRNFAYDNLRINSRVSVHGGLALPPRSQTTEEEIYGFTDVQVNYEYLLICNKTSHMRIDE